MNRIFPVTIFIVLSVTTRAQAPNYQWVMSWGDTGAETAQAMTVDSVGNIYTTGIFEETIDFDPGPAVLNLTANGYVDFYITKHNGAGQLIWAYRIGGWAYDASESIELDQAGNIYLTGIFRGTVDFNPGAGVNNLTADNDNTDIFILKLNNDGAYQWAKNITAANAAATYDLIVDFETGDNYTLGKLEGTMDLNPGPPIQNLMSQGWADVFILKLNTQGNYVWAKGLHGESPSGASAIDLDQATGDVYTTGNFYGTVDFDPSAAVFELTSQAPGTSDVFINKLDSAGNFIWTKAIGGPSVEVPYDIEVDTSANGGVYITGFFSGVMDLDPGPDQYLLEGTNSEDLFFVKLNLEGDFNWGFDINGITALTNGTSICKDPAGTGNIFLSGSFYSTVDLDPGPDTLFATAPVGVYGAFVSKFNHSGSMVWSKPFIGTQNYKGPYIAADNEQNVIVNGVIYHQLLDYVLFDNDTLFVDQYDDILLAKLGCDNGSVVFHDACYSYTSPSGIYEWTESGSFQDTLINCSGCDSVLTIHLTIHYNSESVQDISSCYTYTSPSGLYTWTESGFYYDTIPNAVGCDSLMTLNLTITQDSYHEVFENACTSYTSPSGLYTWTEDGTYMDTIPNSAGCDSILTIHLALHSTYAEWNVEECTNYTSPSGNYTWTVNGIYQDIIPNEMGCDSILTIVLQLLSTTSTQNVVECFSYASPSGLYTWSNSGLHQDVIPNSVGCDSIMNINLVILNVNTNVNVNGNTLSSAAAGATYLWLDCNNDYEAIAGATTQIFAPTQNGNYAAMVTQQNCTDTTACYAITGIGIDELVMSNWKLFPNPTSGIIQLTSEHGTTGTQAILMDVQGRKVDEHYITSLPFVWNMQQPSGIYYLHLISEKDASVLKVLVE